MIFEKIAQAQSFEQVQKILTDTHILLGGRDRPDMKELAPTIGLVLTEIWNRPTFEDDFKVVLEKIQGYLQSKNRYMRADLAESIFNTTAVLAPDKYCFVVNAWQAASAQTAAELERSIHHLVEKGYDISILRGWVDELSSSRPTLWDDLKSSTLRRDPNVYYTRYVQFLATAHKIDEEDIVGVFNKMSQAINGAVSLDLESAKLMKDLTDRYNITLEDFIDRMYTFDGSSKTPSTKFLIMLQDLLNDLSAPPPAYPHDQTAVLQSLIDVFGTQYSPKYTAALRQFEKCYSQYHKSNERVKQWFAKMPYEEAVESSRSQKIDPVKKKIM